MDCKEGEVAHETGWDLGSFAAVLAQLEQIIDNKIQTGQKAQLPLLKTQEQKQGVGTKSSILPMPPALNTT